MHHLVIVELRLGSDLAEDHHHVVLGRALTSDLAARVLLEARIQHGIRDLVGKLVRVALVHRLRGEEEAAPRLLRGGLPRGHDCRKEQKREDNAWSADKIATWKL